MPSVPTAFVSRFARTGIMFKRGCDLFRPTGRNVSAFFSTHADAKAAESGIKWLWPATKEIEMLAVGHEHGCRQTGGRFRYNTVKPLRPEDVQKALRHWQKKIQNFRSFHKEQNGKLWICEDPNSDIDFEYLEGVESSDIINQFSNDPLPGDRSPTWKTRLIPVADDAKCELPEVKAKYPHQYDFIILNHHSFIDGVTMALVTGKLVEILNDVLAGETIDDEPFGVYVNNDEIVRIDSEIAENLQKNPDQLEAMKQEILACDSPPVLLQAFPPPGGKPTTNHVHRHVSQSVLASFTARCKANGVTFNAGIEALINTAIMQMLKEKGVAPDSHAMSINLATDLRRHLKRRRVPILGFHVRPTVHRIETPSDARDNFWDYTRTLHQRLSHLLKSGETLQQTVVREMAQLQPSPAEYFANPKPVRDYGLTNIGDLTAVIPGVGDHLQQTDLSMYNSAHMSVFMMLHQLYTFRGISPYTISYDTSYMTRDTADQLIDTVMALMKEIGSS